MILLSLLVACFQPVAFVSTANRDGNANGDGGSAALDEGALDGGGVSDGGGGEDNADGGGAEDGGSALDGGGTDDGGAFDGGGADDGGHADGGGEETCDGLSLVRPTELLFDAASTYATDTIYLRGCATGLHYAPAERVVTAHGALYTIAWLSTIYEVRKGSGGDYVTLEFSGPGDSAVGSTTFLITDDQGDHFEIGVGFE